MKTWTLTLAALIAATTALAQDRDHSRPRPSEHRPVLPAEPAVRPPSYALPSSKPTAREAEAFVAATEAESARVNEYTGRVFWLATVLINSDTDWLSSKVEAELNARQQALAMQAARFDGVPVDAAVRRKLEILKRSVLLPVPDRAGAAQEMADLLLRLRNRYSTGKVTHEGKELTLEDISERVRVSRNPAELKALWEGWHAVAAPMKSDYARLVELANEGAPRLGFDDTGALTRAKPAAGS